MSFIDPYDQPSLESSPAIHDAEAVDNNSTELDIAALLALLRTHAAPTGPLLDIGCGTGRHCRALHAAGHQVSGVDLDVRMLEAARAAGTAQTIELFEADASALDLPMRFAAALLFNRSLVCFHSHRLASGLFTSVARHLLPGGLFCIDNCCQLWKEVHEGRFANGLAPDGSEQLFFLDADNRFVWRRGAAVDPDRWKPKPDDRLYRLWSLSEVALAGAHAGLELVDLRADSKYLVLRCLEN